MTVDARLREGLQRSMSAIATDPERGLNDARRRGRRRLVIRRAVALLALVALVALVVAAPAVLDLVRDQRNRPATTLNPPPMSGTYTTTVTAQDTADAGMSGRWLLSLDRDGTLRLSSLTDGDLHPSVTRYRTRGSEFLTTALTGDGDEQQQVGEAQVGDRVPRRDEALKVRDARGVVARVHADELGKRCHRSAIRSPLCAACAPRTPAASRSRRR